MFNCSHNRYNFFFIYPEVGNHVQIVKLNLIYSCWTSNCHIDMFYKCFSEKKYSYININCFFSVFQNLCCSTKFYFFFCYFIPSVALHTLHLNSMCFFKKNVFSTSVDCLAPTTRHIYGKKKKKKKIENISSDYKCILVDPYKTVYFNFFRD
jgi:hypothetical protein